MIDMIDDISLKTHCNYSSWYQPSVSDTEFYVEHCI